MKTEIGGDGTSIVINQSGNKRIYLYTKYLVNHNLIGNL